MRCECVSCFLQDPEKEVSDWLSDLTLADAHPDLEVPTDKFVPECELDGVLSHGAQATDRLLIHCVCVCQGVLDPHTVSSSLQQMWALTEVMQSNQTSASIGRFDVSPTRRRQRRPLQAALQRCVLMCC